ncbi:MAG TPA: hypothetical protein VGO59_13120 [Verrucomicrobiae bacterium]|jgi:hypothetical protein
MHVHNNLSANNAALAAFQNQRPAASATSPQTPAPAANPMEAAAPVQTQDAGWEIQDAQDADQVMSSLQQSMTNDPSSVMQSHSQSLFQALGLLQSGED